MKHAPFKWKSEEMQPYYDNLSLRNLTCLVATRRHYAWQLSPLLPNVPQRELLAKILILI